MGKLIHPDVELNFHEAGQTGPVVVLIHGLGANMAFWFPIMTGLARADYRVMTYDLRGHGYSSRPAQGYRLQQMSADLHRLLGHLGFDRVHLVGHSFGARVALHYALQHPEHCASLVVADTQLRALQPPMTLAEWPHWPRWRSELEAQGHTDLPRDEDLINVQILSRFNTRAEDVVLGENRPTLRRRNMGKRGGQRWKELLDNPLVSQELDDEQHLEAPRLQSLGMPVLLAFGEYSHCQPTGRRLQQLLPQAQSCTIPGAGHFFPAVRPKLFLMQLLRFLNHQEPQRHHGH